MPDVLLVNKSDESFREAYQQAINARATGATVVYFDLETLAPIRKYCYLWEDCVGEFVSRLYYDDGAAAVGPDLAPSRNIRGLRVRVRIPDLVEAMRRHTARRGRETKAPIPANVIRGPRSTSTSR